MALGDQTDPIPVKQNDTRPRVRYAPKQGTPPAAVPLTGATAVFNMRVQDGQIAISRAAAIVDATAGTVEYTPTVAWSATNGLHQAEFEITFADGGILTFPPGDKYIWVLVGDDIA